MDEGIVFSTEKGRMCPQCTKEINKCVCKNQTIDAGDGIVRVGRETKGRKGKGVTVITGIALPEKEMKELAKKLKQKCSTGGTLKSGVIEIQGDHRDFLVELSNLKTFLRRRSRAIARRVLGGRPQSCKMRRGQSVFSVLL